MKEPSEQCQTNETEKPRVDMSPHAIETRLRRVEQLRRAALALGKARPIEPEAKGEE